MYLLLLILLILLLVLLIWRRVLDKTLLEVFCKKSWCTTIFTWIIWSSSFQNFLTYNSSFQVFDSTSKVTKKLDKRFLVLFLCVLWFRWWLCSPIHDLLSHFWMLKLSSNVIKGCSTLSEVSSACYWEAVSERVMLHSSEVGVWWRNSFGMKFNSLLIQLCRFQPSSKESWSLVLSPTPSKPPSLHCIRTKALNWQYTQTYLVLILLRNKTWTNLNNQNMPALLIFNIAPIGNRIMEKFINQRI